MTRSRTREYWERYVFNVGCHGVRHLGDVYSKWSDTKQEAWDQIAAECKSNNGFKLSIITYSRQYYTVGYMYKDGDNLLFRVHTSATSSTLLLGPNEKFDAVQHGVL